MDNTPRNQDAPGLRTRGPLMKDAIAQVLRGRIIDGTYSFGLRISDKAIAEELQTSRTPVREALLQLRSEGMIDIRPQSGTFVFGPTAPDIVEICQARAQLEAGAMRLVAHGDVPALAGKLEATVEAIEEALRNYDFAACETLDTGFHEAIVSASSNRYLIESYTRLSGKVRALRHRLPQSVDRVRKGLTDHRQICALVCEGRTEDAARALIDHIEGVNTILIAGLGQAPPHG